MSPATDRVLAEGLTCSKTIIRVHSVHCRHAPHQLPLGASRNPDQQAGSYENYEISS